MTEDDTPKAAVAVEGVGGAGDLTKGESSTQLPERRVRTVGIGVKPPYNPDMLAAQLEKNETLAAGIRKKSRYEVGFGFDVVPRRGVDPDDADEQQEAVAKSFWRGQDSKWQTAAGERSEPTTPEEVKELARQEYHGIGYCALEVLTDMEGRPVGLAYIPGRTIRTRKPQSQFDQPRHPEEGTFISPDGAQFASRGYVQVRDGRRRYFGEFGDRYRGLDVEFNAHGDDDPPRVDYVDDDTDGEPIFVDRETGEVVEGSAEELPNGPANELIFVRNPSPLTQDYGVPDWISATRTISADEAAKAYNQQFFDNDTIPRFVIKVTGGELTQESKDDLRNMLDGLREESHRAVLLEVEKFQSQLDKDIQIELEPLGQGVSEEMDFRRFREKNEHEIAKVLEVPPILIGVTETSNRSNSKEQVREFALEVIQPEQHKFAERLYQTIHQTALGVTDYTIEYELRGAEQPREDAETARRKIQAVNGAVPINRALEMVGLDPLPDEHPVDGQTLVANVPNGGDVVEQDRPDFAPPEENKVGELDWEVVEAELAAKGQIETMQFASSNLVDGLYDFEENQLFLSFDRDGTNSLYAYMNVPVTEWQALTQAGSHGSYHYHNIRLVYAYIEITNFHSRLPEGPSPDPEDVPEDIPADA